MKLNALKQLKYILNSYSDEELEDIDLWINNDKYVEVIAVDENSISLITEKSSLKIDGREW